jgi:hypothetical protein
MASYVGRHGVMAGVIGLAKRTSLAVAVMAAALVVGLVAHVPLALAENGESPGGDGSLLNSLLDQPQPTVTNDQAGTTGTPTASTTTDSGSSTTDSATTTGTVSPVATVIPAVTPLVVQDYSTEPAQLESGSRFRLTLKITNPGADDADGVVVRIGPSSDRGWGSADELAVLGGGSAKYVGPIKAGASDDTASFQLIANPASPGGLRSIPVEITWKSNNYEHTTSSTVGLLVNSAVALDASFHESGAVVKKPFAVTLKIKNRTGRAVKGVCVTFSGKGARPSRQETITVGDLGAGDARSASATFTAPLVGRAQLLATISYVDDFGDRRTLQVLGWAHVQRTDAQSADTTSDSGVRNVLLVLAALFGLSG